MTDHIILHFVYRHGPSFDMRTFSVYRTALPGQTKDTELYKFYHPVTGFNVGTTTFYRQNPQTLVFETAGVIEWLSISNANVQFGIEEVPIKDLRRAKKSNSRSRRFKAGGSMYKWKVADNRVDLYCVDCRGRIISTWLQERLELLVASRVEDILDRLVVTCMLNLWVMQHGYW